MLLRFINEILLLLSRIVTMAYQMSVKSEFVRHILCKIWVEQS